MDRLQSSPRRQQPIACMIPPPKRGRKEFLKHEISYHIIGTPDHTQVTIKSQRNLFQQGSERSNNNKKDHPPGAGPMDYHSSPAPRKKTHRFRSLQYPLSENILQEQFSVTHILYAQKVRSLIEHSTNFDKRGALYTSTQATAVN